MEIERNKQDGLYSCFRAARIPGRTNFKGFICEVEKIEESDTALAQMAVERAKKWNFKVSTNDFIREQV